MKVTAFYYLDYPDCSPVDPRYAATTMYVEVGQENSTTNDFSETYKFQVYTVNYVADQFFKKNLPLLERSVLVVAELDDLLILELLSSHVDNLAKLGEAV